MFGWFNNLSWKKKAFVVGGVILVLLFLGSAFGNIWGIDSPIPIGR